MLPAAGYRIGFMGKGAEPSHHADRGLMTPSVRAL